MKKYTTILIVLFTFSLGMVSCEDYLDADPEMGIDGEVVYSEYYSYKGAVDRANWLVMNYVATSSNWGAYVGAMGDEQQAVKADMPVYKSINQGLWQDSNWRDFGMNFNSETNYGSDPYYNSPAGKSLKAIRAMGLAIENIEKLTDFPAEVGASPTELKNQLLGQAHALRAWHMFEVVRRYGPITLVDTTGGERKTFSSEFNFDQVKPTFQQCADLIAADCEDAVKYLPNRWKDPTDVGRLTKASAYAIEAMAYMYAASPLMNTEGDALPFGQDSYDETYAKKGIQAMVNALKLVNSGATRYKLYDKDSYMENWMSQDRAISDEALFQPVPTNSDNWNLPMNRSNSGVGWFLPQHDGGWAVFNVPTQNAVDKFETINGYPVENFSSADPSFDPKNPYDNRDPRLRSFIYCPGDKMYLADPGGGNNSTFENQAWSNPGDEGWHYKYYRGKSLVYTGYFDAGKWRKLGYNKYDNKWSQNYYRIFPLIRLADMYLGLAELGNEVYGPSSNIPEAVAAGIDVTTASQAINKIRNRVGMPDVRSEFLTDKGTFRDRIRNEWAVEFYGEFRRWRDIRRWRIAKNLLAEGIYEANVTKNADGSFSYVNKKLDVPRVFEDKHYWYPLDIKYVNMFESFKQNPGW
ncbi:RagB/SusD family nutrient uptake outer membrane protein [Zobellia galactanivorans]|nr:RagB/SusD family nutrient uptake outer membrane protein [Zobellia galactanivorans]MBU3024718.1 RagB/SusD family nutrient uptake outer membrane protein [Zobellia galactanivorans]MDO6810648.1 RagB/SusD family nutrient uptake outer membrane protein [Zobellia galactanivorans]